MNIIAKAKKYIVDSYAEMKKVSWPSKKQTTNFSLLVISLSIGMAAFFGILDYIFSYGINTIISR